VVLSVHDDATTRRKAIDAGAAAFVSKSDSSDILVETIRRAPV
jgi:DNA-binding NarL/FixJ family response regulator